MYDILPKDNSKLLLLFSRWKQKNDAGENHRFFKFLKCITSYYRYCNLQRNSEAVKAKKDTHTYAHIHEHTLTQHMKNIGTYTTHIHSRERVLAGIHHAYNKYTFSHTRYAHNTQKKFKDTGTYSLTHTEKQHIVTKKACPIRKMACTIGSQL
jgi:hypothetical protein